MAEKDRGFKFKNLFFRDDKLNVQEKQNNKASASENTDYNNIKQSNTVEKDPSLVEDFIQRLQNLINQNNQPGFDFLEFTESLFEEKQNPTP